MKNRSKETLFNSEEENNSISETEAEAEYINLKNRNKKEEVFLSA